MDYMHKAQPYLDAIANGVFNDTRLRNWLLEKTPHETAYRNAFILNEEQHQVRGQTKQPFWQNYWCGKDKCMCHPKESKSIESDAIFFLRNSGGRVMAMHIEFKHPRESFDLGQAEAYPLRADCFTRTHSERKTLNQHQDWTTVLFCGPEKLNDPEIKFFHRVITHDEAYQKIPSYG